MEVVLEVARGKGARHNPHKAMLVGWWRVHAGGGLLTGHTHSHQTPTTRTRRVDDSRREAVVGVLHVAEQVGVAVGQGEPGGAGHLGAHGGGQHAVHVTGAQLRAGQGGWRAVGAVVCEFVAGDVRWQGMF